jgi:hypothetical protein
VLDEQAPEQTWKPVAQVVATHWLPEQALAVTFAVGQAAHTPLHSLLPELHVSPQVVPLHVATPLGSVAHGVQLAPQLATELLSRQTPEQRWVLALQTQAWVVTSQVSLVLHWVSNAQPGLQRPLARSQYEKPTHAVERQSGGVWHVELAHTWLVPHAWPHPLQLRGLAVVSTHSPLQSVRPVGHVGPEPPVPPTPVPALPPVPVALPPTEPPTAPPPPPVPLLLPPTAPPPVPVVPPRPVSAPPGPVPAVPLPAPPPVPGFFDGEPDEQEASSKTDRVQVARRTWVRWFK